MLLLSILTFFSCIKGQDTILKVNSIQNNTIEIIAEKGDSLLVSFYLHKEFSLKSKKETHIVNIVYQKKQTDNYTKAFIKNVEIENKNDKIKFELILNKFIQKKDFLELTNQNVFIINQKHEIKNKSILSQKLSNFINDSIKLNYSYKNNRKKYHSLSIPVNFDL